MQLAVIPSVECTGCGAQHNAQNGRFPVGWSRQGGNAWCVDCTGANVPNRHYGNSRNRTR